MVLQAHELVLKVDEGRVRLEVRILLCNHVDSRHHAGQRGLGRDNTGDVLLSKGACSGLAGNGKLLENLPLMLGVALDDVDQVRDHVVALLEDHVDVGPRPVDVFLKTNKAVPSGHKPEEKHNGCGNGNDGHGFHEPMEPAGAL